MLVVADPTGAPPASNASMVRSALSLLLVQSAARAPSTGTVLVKAIEPGELATPGRTVAALVDLSRMELKAFIPEKDIGKIELGDPARVRVDAFPERRFGARVARVDQQAQFTPRDVHMPEERVRLVFGVTLALENPDGVLKPGMPTDAWILWQEGTSWPEHLIETMSAKKAILWPGEPPRRSCVTRHVTQELPLT